MSKDNKLLTRRSSAEVQTDVGGQLETYKVKLNKDRPLSREEQLAAINAIVGFFAAPSTATLSVMKSNKSGILQAGLFAIFKQYLMEDMRVMNRKVGCCYATFTPPGGKLNDWLVAKEELLERGLQLT